MLALTRKKGEALVINNNIEVTILEIRGDQIKIGISAPKDVPIYRKEVYLQIQKENEAAISVDSLDMLKDFMKDRKVPGKTGYFFFYEIVKKFRELVNFYIFRTDKAFRKVDKYAFLKAGRASGMHQFSHGGVNYGN